MAEGDALRVAVDLVRMPSQVHHVRAASLPEGVELLLRVAAGDAVALDRALALTGRSPEVIREGGTFFIEQILLAPEADSYRVLGARQGISNADLRRNMALLVRWLHPDVARNDQRSVFAARITDAWNNLKTPERRAAYDRSPRASAIGLRASTAANSPDTQKSGSKRSRGIRHRNFDGAGDAHRPSLLRAVLLFLDPLWRRGRRRVKRKTRRRSYPSHR